MKPKCCGRLDMIAMIVLHNQKNMICFFLQSALKFAIKRGGLMDSSLKHSLDEGRQHVLRHVGLALVHVLDQRLQVLELDVAEHDERGLVRTGGGPEHGLEDEERRRWCCDMSSIRSQWMDSRVTRWASLRHCVVIKTLIWSH